MNLLVGMLAVFLVGCSQLVMADDASRRALAEELLDLMGMKQQTQQTMTLMRHMQETQLEQMRPQQPSGPGADQADQIRTKTMDIMEEELSWEKMKDDYVTIYAETFTEEELQGAVEFYRSPAGRKWIEKMPELTRRSLEVSQQRAQSLTPRILDMYKVEMDRTREGGPSSSGESGEW